MQPIRSTTILSVRRGGRVALGGGDYGQTEWPAVMLACTTLAGTGDTVCRTPTARLRYLAQDEASGTLLKEEAFAKDLLAVPAAKRLVILLPVGKAPQETPQADKHPLDAVLWREKYGKK